MFAHGGELHLSCSSLYLFVNFFFFKKPVDYFFKFLYLIYFWLRWLFVAVCRLSLDVVSRSYSSLRCEGFFITVASLVAEHGL